MIRIWIWKGLLNHSIRRDSGSHVVHHPMEAGDSWHRRCSIARRLQRGSGWLVRGLEVGPGHARGNRVLTVGGRRVSME